MKKKNQNQKIIHTNYRLFTKGQYPWLNYIYDYYKKRIDTFFYLFSSREKEDSFQNHWKRK